MGGFAVDPPYIDKVADSVSLVLSINTEDTMSVEKAGQDLLEKLDLLKGELENYLATGFKAAGRRTRSALTGVTKTGKVFRATSLETDKNKE